MPGARTEGSWRPPLRAALVASAAFVAGALLMHHWDKKAAGADGIPAPSTVVNEPDPPLGDTTPTGSTVDQQEIARLRSRVSQLRNQLDTHAPGPAAEPPGGQAKTYLTEIPAPPPNATYPSTAWADAGFATPRDALQTHWWAIRSGDVEKFKASVVISGSLRALVDKSFPEELRLGRSIEEGFMMPAQALDRSRGFDAYSILDEQRPSDNEVDLDVETRFKDGGNERQTWRFVLQNGQWRQWIDEEFVGLRKP